MIERVVEITSMNAEELRCSINSIVKELRELKDKIKPVDETVLLSPYEVCKWLSISKPTLVSWTKKKLLKSYKIGNRVYYKQIEILGLIDHSKSVDLA